MFSAERSIACLQIIQPSAAKESDSHEAQPTKEPTKKRRTKTQQTEAEADPAQVKRPKPDKSSRPAGPKSSTEVAAGMAKVVWSSPANRSPPVRSAKPVPSQTGPCMLRH